MLGQAIGDLLPSAVGVALSPIPIIAVIVMLLSARGRANSAAFLAGWIVGVVGACVVLLLISGSLDTGSGGSPSTTSSVIKLVLGAFLLVLARRNVRGRAHGDGEAPLPR